MSDEKSLILTVGLPRSGKSTWARKQGLPIVCPDSIRLALHGKPFIGLAEPFVWAIAHVMVRALFLSGHQKVILDATNITRKAREEWKSDEWMRSYHTFGLGRSECLRRVSEEAMDQAHRDALNAVIERMAEKYEPVFGCELE